VDSEIEQQAAGEIARTIEGARDVRNQLTVVRQAERKAVERHDRQIVKSVKGWVACATSPNLRRWWREDIIVLRGP
jgi:osmotically-inducible protein OsmY